ncbi:hypothetical protein D3C71_1694460 [compost metagenome]
MPQGTQLLQRFSLLEPAWAPADEVVQEADTVGVHANMTAIGHPFRQHVAGLGKGIAGPGQRRSAERQGQAVLVTHHLDRVRVEHGFRFMDRLGQGGDTGFRMRRQVGRHLVDDHRRDQRLVALHVDHNGVSRQP